MIGTEYSALTVNVLKEKGHFFKDSVRTFQWVEISGFPLGVEFSPRLDEQRQKAGKFRFDRGNDFNPAAFNFRPASIISAWVAFFLTAFKTLSEPDSAPM